MFRRCLPFRVKAPHVVLGVAANATEDQIKAKYKDLARRLHPDMPGGNEKKFQELNAAYSILKLRASARKSGAASGSKKARTMGMYRGEEDFGDDDDSGGGSNVGKNQWKSYVDEEEAAELRAQERAAEEMRRMQSQTFTEMMWTMSTYELLMSMMAMLATVMLTFHRHLDVSVGDRIDFSDVRAEGDQKLKFQEPVQKLNEEQKLALETWNEMTSKKSQTTNSKFYSLRECVMVYDADRAHARRVEAKPISADLIDERKLITQSPIVARIDGSTAVNPYQRISLPLKERVSEKQWANVDVGPAVVLMLEAARRVTKNDPGQYRITTIEYQNMGGGVESGGSSNRVFGASSAPTSSTASSSGDNVPRVVVTIVNDKFKPNTGRCQRILISGYEKLHPELIKKRREMLRDEKIIEKDLLNLKLVFPVNDEGIKAPPPEKDPRAVIFEPPIIFERTKA